MAWHYNAVNKKKKREGIREGERGAEGLKRVRRGAGKEERKCRKQRGKERRWDEWRQESTGYTVSSKSLRGGGGREARMRGKDEQCGAVRKEVSKPVEIG